MPLKITDDCIACGACEPVCPNEAISLEADIYAIDPARCNECFGLHPEPQCYAVCPTTCIVPDPEHRETLEELLWKKTGLHPEGWDG